MKKNFGIFNLTLILIIFVVLDYFTKSWAIENLFIELNRILNYISENESMCQQTILNSLQKVNAELSGIMKSFGTHNFDDLITICLGNDFSTKNFKTKS